MSQIVDFSEVLITKFCHDLSSTIGAVNNGTEILRDSDDETLRQKALAIIELNGEESVAKIRFYRFLYGIVSTQGEIDIAELKQLARDFFKGTKIELQWNNVDSGGIVQLTSKAAKLVLNMIYLASTVLIAGGRIEINIHRNGGSKKVSVEAYGDRIKVANDIEAILDNQSLIDVKLGNVQAHLASKLATALNAPLACVYEDDRFILNTAFS